MEGLLKALQSLFTVQPSRRRAVSSADRRTSRVVRVLRARSEPGDARIPVSWFSARRYAVSATGPTGGVGTKKARCRCDTGLLVIVQGWWPSVTTAKDARAACSPNNRLDALGIAVGLRDLTTTKSSVLFLCLGLGWSRMKRDSGHPLHSLSVIDARTRHKVRGVFPQTCRVGVQMLSPSYSGVLAPSPGTSSRSFRDRGERSNLTREEPQDLNRALESACRVGSQPQTADVRPRAYIRIAPTE